jgi:CRISPR/Cas system-associated exonuclease Cas4 (RecB family)
MSDVKNHKEREHARLSASGAKRWMACPRSVALEETIPERESPFALEGTKAHEMAEAYLRLALNEWDEHAVNLRVKELEPDMEMIDHAKDYAAYCHDLFEEEQIQDQGAYPIVESRLVFDDWVPGGFGTGDFSIVGNKRITIVDYKYGKGVKVDAEDNPQMRLYALGILQEYGWLYPEAKEVAMHIYQPRIRNISVEIIAVKELLAWGKMIKPLAKQADEDKGDFNPGEHCKFCRARAICKARANTMLKALEKITGGDK